MKTSAAAQTQTATVIPPTRTPTVTLTPSKTPTRPVVSPTFLYSLFTATFELPVENTMIAASATAGYLKSIGKVDIGDGIVVALDKPWACRVRYTPALVVPPKKKFTAYWLIANIGTQPWTSNTVDFVYKGGFRHEGSRVQDIRSTVGSGRTLKISTEFMAPQRAGEQHSYYVLQVGNNAFCPVKLSFQVK